jgi:hypothetical protein
MPYDAISDKLEETDPDLVDDVRGADAFHDLEDDYRNYVRDEVIDWTPDAPYLESDHPVRDPSTSRSILNLHYNGTRGFSPELPRHPELFYGFTGNDPRGVVNDPRFDEMRGHITGRVADLTVRMGDNDDMHVAERPWTGQSLSYDMKEVQRRLKKSTRVFSVQKEGRPWGNNTAADLFAANDVRLAQLASGDEALAYRTESGDGAARFFAGDHGSGADLNADSARGVGTPSTADQSGWRHAVGEADLGVQKYAQKRGAGRSRVEPGAMGGGRLRNAGVEQDMAESRAAKVANRRTLGATMALAARNRRATKDAHADQDWAAAREGYVAHGGLAPGRDVAMAFRRAVEDQSRRPADGVQDGDGGALGAAAGLTPAAHPERAVRRAEATAAPNSHLTNAVAIATGLREGTAAALRRVAGAVVADGARVGPAAEGRPAGGLRPASAADARRVAGMAQAPVARAAAAEGLVVHAYGLAAPTGPEARVANGRRAYDALTWRGQREAAPLGKSAAPGEWRSATQGQTKSEAVFGPADEVPTAGAPVMGPKSLRAGGWSHTSDLTDDFAEDGVMASA